MTKKLTTNQKLDLIIDRLDALESAATPAPEAEVDQAREAEIALIKAAVQAQADEEAVAHEARTAPVSVEALTLVSYDGDPATDGCEWYAPADFDAGEWCAANGIEALEDGDRQPVIIAGNRFTTTRIQAEALVKACAVRIVA